MSWLVRVKENIVALAAIFTAAAAIFLAPIHFDERYAHAGDLKILQETTSKHTDVLRASVLQQQLNWLEYYNDRIRILTRERDRNPSQALQIDREIDDMKSRKQFLEKSLIDQSNTR